MSNLKESARQHSHRVMDLITNGGYFVHGLDKAYNGQLSIIKVLSDCDGLSTHDAISKCLGWTGLTQRTIAERIRGLKAINVLANSDFIQFMPKFERKYIESEPDPTEIHVNCGDKSSDIDLKILTMDTGSD